MPTAYSYDFRKKAIEAYKRGERKIEICRLLNISRNTLDLWLKKEAETGDFRSETDSKKGRSPQINDEDKFRAFIKEYGGKTQKEMARLWGDGVSQQTISKTMKRWEITRKKRSRDGEVSSPYPIDQDKNLWIPRKK